MTKLPRMAALPPTNLPRHVAWAALDREPVECVLADSRMLDEIGQGVYAGDDPVAIALVAYRAATLGHKEMG